MISIKKQGYFVLGESKSHTRLLMLDGNCYVWLTVPAIGDILSIATKRHELHTVFSEGEYRLYEVKDEEGLVDLQHLELEVGKGHWQGFLLLTGLPNRHKKRSRIISTQENVSVMNKGLDLVVSNQRKEML